MLEWIWQAKEVARVLGADQYAFITALAAAVAVLVTSLRKRKDVDIAEILRKNEILDARVTALETELIQATLDRFALRRVLAENGWEDPTLEATA